MSEVDIVHSNATDGRNAKPAPLQALRPFSGRNEAVIRLQGYKHMHAASGLAPAHLQADGRSLRHSNIFGAPVLLFFQVRAPHAPSRLFAHHQFKYVDEP